MQFLMNVPVWVFPLFVVLVVVGGLSMRTRKSPVFMYAMLPFLMISPLQAMWGMATTPLAWAAFTVALTIGVTGGFRLQGRWIISKADGWVHVRGEWLTLVVMMILFGLNFVRGAAEAVAPDFVSSQGFVLTFAIMAALAGGSFLGRSTRVLRA